MNLHKLELKDIRGYGRNKPFFHVIFLLGALSLGCIPPLGSGYMSKSMLHEALLELISSGLMPHNIAVFLKVVEILFVIGGGLTIAYMLKIYICVFWQKPEKEYPKGKYLTTASKAALVLSAAPLTIMALFPNSTIAALAGKAMPFFTQEVLGKINFYSAENLIGALKSIAVGVGVYLILIRPIQKMNISFKMLDLEDDIYRPVLLTILPAILFAVCGVVFDIPGFVLGAALPTVATAVDRSIWDLPQYITVGVKKLLFPPMRKKKPIPVGNRFTYRCGRIMDSIALAFNKLAHRVGSKKQMRTDYEYVFDAAWKNIAAGGHKAFSSVSFGLLLLCFGLLITCIFLLTK